MTQLIGYRHAAYDSPWWANPNSRRGRFHRALEHPTHYWSLHPLGPAAEMLRHNVGPAGVDDADTVTLNLWVAALDGDDIVDVGFANCPDFGIQPDELVGDDYRPTQALADELRGGDVRGIRVPSAALPWTDNLVLFGPRVIHPYLLPTITPEECRTGHVTDGGRPAAEVVPLVRWIGAPHAALDEWKVSGDYRALEDPMATHW
jgi:hypothetical protein